MQALHAGEEKQHTLRLLYAVHMSQAQQAWEDGNVKRMQKLLSNYQSAGENADVRGFEWYYLRRLSRNSLSARNLSLPGTLYLTAFSGDGTRLAAVSTTGSTEGSARVSVWDAQTARHPIVINPAMYSLSAIDPNVYALALSPDGTKLVTGHKGNSVALLDANTGQLRQTLTHQDRNTAPANSEQEPQIRDVQYVRAGLTVTLNYVVSAVAFSPDGRLLATGRGAVVKGNKYSIISDGRTHDVKLWDAATGQEFATLAGHTGGISAIVFSSDGKLLATASADNTIKLWSVPATQTTTQPIAPILSVTNADSAINLLAFSPDRRILAAGCADHTVRLWDMSTRQRLGQNFAAHKSELTAIAFAPDSRKFATASADKTVRVWAVPDERTQSPRAPQAPDRTVAARRAAWPVWLQPAVYHPGMAASMNVLTTLSLTAGQQQENGGVENVAELGNEIEPLTELNVRKGAVLGIEFSADGQNLTTIGTDAALKVWSVASAPEWQTLGNFAGAVLGLAFTSEGHALAVGSGGNVLSLRDTETGQARWTLKPGGAIRNVAFSSDGKLLATAGPNKLVKLWDVAHRDKLPKTLEHPNTVNAAVFAPHSHLLATGCSDGTVQLWNIDDGQSKMLAGHRYAVEALAFSPDAKLLATASDDQTVKLWDVATGQEHPTPLMGHLKGVKAVAFSPDGQILATGGADNLLKLWDVATGTPYKDALTGLPFDPLAGHTAPINYLAFSPDGKRIASASDDGSVRLWDVESAQEVAELKGAGGPVYIAVFAPADPTGQTIATGNSDGTVKLWRAPIDKLTTQQSSLP
ncbi:MAG TPA: WD40 repeat domain-containing protein [Pyrinomonadaceae bacterium]|nr:WD40 repeat domain-containing protein [Pyrinomonadaceae bacterium]